MCRLPCVLSVQSQQQQAWKRACCGTADLKQRDIRRPSRASPGCIISLNTLIRGRYPQPSSLRDTEQAAGATVFPHRAAVPGDAAKPCLGLSCDTIGRSNSAHRCSDCAAAADRARR